MTAEMPVICSGGLKTVVELSKGSSMIGSKWLVLSQQCAIKASAMTMPIRNVVEAASAQLAI